MSEHYLKAAMPERVIEKDPVVFRLWTDSQKAGELRVSQGGLHWVNRHGKQGVDMTWEQFAKLVETL